MKKNRQNLSFYQVSQSNKEDEKLKPKLNQTTANPKGLPGAPKRDVNKLSVFYNEKNMEEARISALSQVSFGSLLNYQKFDMEQDKKESKEMEEVASQLGCLKTEIQNFKIKYQEQMTKNNDKIKELSVLLKQLLAPKSKDMMNKSIWGSNNNEIRPR